MKAYGGVDAFIQVFLPPLFVAAWSFSGVALFNPGESVPISN
jgi:hypothetical protein